MIYIVGGIKWGSVARKEESEDDITPVQLRIHSSVIDEIDLARHSIKRGKKPSRHAWIIGAIEEKLARAQEVSYDDETTHGV